MLQGTDGKSCRSQVSMMSLYEAHQHPLSKHDYRREWNAKGDERLRPSQGTYANRTLDVYI